MGQGNQVCRHQGGVIRAIATKYSVMPVPRMTAITGIAFWGPSTDVRF
jgi:hypothetical protein